jgi:tetratricopeptide (TPR) repeat protein
VTDHFLLGDEQYKREDLEQARRHFDRALDLQPAHFWAKYFLAVCQLRLGHPDVAKASLTGCLMQRPDFFYGYLLRGLAHMQLGESGEAEEDFQQTLERRPNPYAQYGAYVNRGVLRVRQRKLDEAVADLQRASGLLPGQYQAYVNLAQAYQQQQKGDEAARVLDRALPLVRQPAALYRARAQLALQRQDPGAALQDFDQAIALEPPGLAEDHAERGRVLHCQQRHAEAVKAYDEALKLLPDYPDAHRGRAEALVGLQRYREAIRSFDQSLKSGRPDADVYWARGLARAHLGEHAEAVADYTRALALRAGPPLYADRGWALLHCDAWKLALLDFEEAIRLDRACVLGYIGRGYVRAQHGQYQDAITDAEIARQLEPKSPEGLFNLACVFAQAAGRVAADSQQPDREPLTGRCQERAVELLRKALDRLPNEGRLPFWRENAADPDLGPIRASPGFKRLEEHYPRPGG